MITRYDLALLNVESRYEVPRIVEALRRRGHGCLCFHGLPGSGKSALAEHIAHELQRPLLIRQASDLVSKYLGETEANMARMFEEAESEQAMLLLDEADSYLRSRQRAEHTFEVSEVNEMLQGKLRFLPLRPAQREAMFAAETSAGIPLDATPCARLALLDQLTPGDFATVKPNCSARRCRPTNSWPSSKLSTVQNLTFVSDAGSVHALTLRPVRFCTRATGHPR